jgi:hypothetical protein
MEQNDKDSILIQRYFDLRLSETELDAFEERLKNDETFVQKVALYQTSIDIVNKKFPDEAQKQRNEHWQAAISNPTEKTSKKKYPQKLLIGIAASILLMLSIWQLSYPSQELNLDLLLQEAWDKNVGIDVIVRDNSNNADKEILQDALKAYKNNNYSHSLELLKVYDASFIDYHDVLILRSLSQHKLQNSSLALKTLDTLEAYNAAITKWYKGLIHLSNGDIDNAKNYLVIPNSNDEELKIK